MKKLPIVIISLASIMATACGGSSSKKDPVDQANKLEEQKAALGSQLYSDQNLSLDRTQSCATCHSLEHGFVENRRFGGTLHPVSRGDDRVSFGDRNAPTAGYAMFSPDFQANGTHTRQGKAAEHQAISRTYTGAIGGQFHDGREKDLKGQAGGPPTNPVEMNMPSKAAVVERIKENAKYIESFETIFGVEIFNDVEKAYGAMAESIAAFEKTDVFAKFDSRFDRSLQGDDTAIPLFSKADHGKDLFFSSDLNCSACHQLHNQLNRAKETFTNYEYHNIGVPFNQAVADLRNNNPKTPSTPADEGLKKFTKKNSDAGKFKVPTLRNVAVTGPYMHNGVFSNLRTVVEFYDHFANPQVRINNPETGTAWADPEVDQNISSTELNASKNLSDAEVEALVCFLRTLTDKKFENRMPVEDGISDCYSNYDKDKTF